MSLGSLEMKSNIKEVTHIKKYQQFNKYEVNAIFNN